MAADGVDTPPVEAEMEQEVAQPEEEAEEDEIPVNDQLMEGLNRVISEERHNTNIEDRNQDDEEEV